MQRLGSLLSVGKLWTMEDTGPLGERYSSQELIATTLHDPPYTIVTRQEDGSVSCSGYVYDLWRIMASVLNIRFKMITPQRRDYGTLHENGTWTGMVGDLVYGRADVAVSTLDMTPDRTAAVDFLDVIPVTTTTYRFYVRTDQQGDIPPITMNFFEALLKPLQMDVWWALLASIIVFSAILWIVYRRESAEDQNETGDTDLPSCIFMCFMAMVGQGWTAIPASLPGRIVTTFCWFLGIIITTIYTANLISYLTIVDIRPPIVSLKHFSEQPGWKFSVTPGHSSLIQWKHSSDIYERELYRRATTGEDFLPLDFTSAESARRSTSGLVMMYASINAIARYRGEEACSFVAVPYAPKRDAGVFMAVSKRRNSLRRDLNKILLKMSNTGLVQGLRKRWVNSRRMVCEPPSGYSELALGDVISVLLIMPLTLCFSLIVLALEFLVFRNGGISRIFTQAYTCLPRGQYYLKKA